VARPLKEYTWKDLNIGCVITEVGSASDYKTGDWKTDKPVVDTKRCIKCGVCWLFCPEGCIDKTEEGFFIADLSYCKGCGICSVECWTGCIAMVEEEK
jgi:pyruvate ferredoxin oxidoreductase delta subunit